MCVSRLRRVLRQGGAGVAYVEDLDGRVEAVSLIALDPPPPKPGEWLVVHSGYALARVDRADAEAVAAEVRSAGS